MKVFLFLLSLILAGSCTSTGYIPSYIISHDEEVEEQNIDKEEEIR